MNKLKAPNQPLTAATQKALQKLQHHAYTLCTIVNSAAADSSLSLLSLLTILDQQGSPWKEVQDQQVVEFLFLGSKSLPITHEACSAFCKFMSKQCSKQIRLTSLRSFQCDACLQFLLQGLESTQNDELRVDMLRALSALVFDNTTNISKFYPRLAILLLSLADPSVKPLYVRRMAINCIGNMCTNAGVKLQAYYKDYYKVLLSNLGVVEDTSSGVLMVKTFDFPTSDSGVRKIASSTLRALHFVLSQDKSLATDPLCDIISIVHTFVFMNVSVQAYIATANKSAPLITMTASTSTPQQRTGQLRTRQTPIPSMPTASPTLPPTSLSPSSLRTQLLWRPTTLSRPLAAVSSDSELSDSDSPLQHLRKQKEDAKIKINGLLCLTVISKISPRTLYPQWHRFLPDTMSIFISNNSTGVGSTPTTYCLSPVLRSDNQPFSLFTLLLYDTTTTVRITVCNTLIAMLEGSKQYLSIASERSKKSSFTSLSERVASILRDIHTGMIYALDKEQTVQVQVLMMKVTSTLISNCSYERLSPGHLTRLYLAVLDHWSTAANGLCLGILQTIDAVLNAQCSDEEVSRLVQTTIETRQGDSFANLVDLLLVSCALPPVDTETTELIVGAWQTLAVLGKTYFSIAWASWKKIQPILEETLANKEPSLRTAALKFIEACASSMEQSLLEIDCATKEDKLHTYSAWWKTVLKHYLQQASADNSSTVRTAMCDCMSSMSKQVFSRFNPRLQKLSVAFLLPLPRDGEANVRAAACRALGFFVLFPDLREDPLFVSDVALVLLEPMSDKVLAVRVRASWAQGNVCDALVIESERSDLYVSDCISPSLWMQLLNSIAAASLDNDKLRSNAVRALGSLLRITPNHYFQQGRMLSLLAHAMEALIKNIETGTLKTRWNACHAANNLLHNPHFPIGYQDDSLSCYAWTSNFYQALCMSLTQCKNFKVRIHACLALTTPSLYTQYGSSQQILIIVEAILETHRACSEDKDTEFQELGYKQQLLANTLHALTHLEPWIEKSQIKKTVQCLLEQDTSSVKEAQFSRSEETVETMCQKI